MNTTNNKNHSYKSKTKTTKSNKHSDNSLQKCHK